MEATLPATTPLQSPVQLENSAPEFSSSLDTLETTVSDNLPANYDDYRRLPVREEYLDVFNLYIRWDGLHNTHHAEQLLECRHYAWFVRNKISGDVKVVANACRLRWCPVCSEAKRMRIKTAVSAWVKTIKRPKFFTVTLKHSDTPLAAQIDRLYKAFRLFRKHKTLTDKCRGGIWFFQIKRSKKTGQWHPHLHIILDADYINQVTLQDDWLITTGDSYVVDIRAIKDPGKVTDYVSRYCAKPCNLSDYKTDDQDEIANILHGKRLCGRFGTGAQCDFKPRRVTDAIEWERVGTWIDIVSNRERLPEYRKLLKAWSTGEPFTAEAYEALKASRYEETAKAQAYLKQVVERQLVFDEFVRHR
jgi:hypothetical protein